LLFQGKNGFAKAPQCYVIRTLSVFYTSYKDIQHVSATEESQNVFHTGTTRGNADKNSRKERDSNAKTTTATIKKKRRHTIKQVHDKLQPVHKVVISTVLGKLQ
jgi:hypothetical protein